MILYTVVNHSPKQVEQWLNKNGISIRYTPAKKSDSVYAVMSMNEFRKIQNKKARVILFCGPLFACSLQANNLDIKQNLSPPFYGIEYCPLNFKVFQKAEHAEYESVKYDYTNNIIESLESKSLLNTLMTAIYTLPTSAQKPVKIAVINWLSYDGNTKNLPSLLGRLNDSVRLSSNGQTLLSLVLQSEIATLYAKALKTKGNAKDLAKEFEISEYDLNYMFSVRSSAKDYKKNKI